MTPGGGSSGTWVWIEEDENCVLTWVTRKSEGLKPGAHYTQNCDEMDDEHCLTQDLELFNRKKSNFDGLACASFRFCE